MRIISHFAVLVAVLVVAVVPVAIAGTAGAARSSTTPPIGRQLAELKGSDTEGSYSANIAGEGSGLSVAISDRIAVVAAYAHANGAGRAYVFEA